MSEEMRNKYPKPPGVSKEVWDNYLKSIEEFSKKFLNVTINKISKKLEEITKKFPIDKLELVQEEEDHENI